MTAFDELTSTGRLGDDGAKTLYGVVRAVGKGRGFRPPEGHTHWTDEAVVESAHEFLSDSRTPSRLVYLTVHATDDESMERLLNKMVLNFLRDQGRKTERGRLVRRINSVLSDDDRFVSAHDRWSHAAGDAIPSTATPEDLEAAAAGVKEVTVPRWSDQTPRSHPHADAPSIARLCHAVLTAANGSLTAGDLAKAISGRLGLRAAPIAALLDVPEPTDERYTTMIEGYADVADARAVFESLSEREKAIMATLHLGLRELYDAIGVKKSQASPVRNRAIATVKEATAEMPNRDVVRHHVVDLAQAWLQDRTQQAGAAS